MPEAISNTSPLLYLHRINRIDWLAELFDRVWVPGAVIGELDEGRRLGYDVPEPASFSWVHVAEPKSIPAEWSTLDLGPGEVAALALAVEYPERIALLDDGLARQVASKAELTVWGTLKILLEAKSKGLAPTVGPHITSLGEKGMWISEDVRQRILVLAGEG